MVIRMHSMENYTPHYPAKLPEDIRTWAREMRGRMTDAEALLWMLLRNHRIAGAKFRRQHPVERYILDYYCVEKKLAIELDGGQHGFVDPIGIPEVEPAHRCHDREEYETD